MFLESGDVQEHGKGQMEAGFGWGQCECCVNEDVLLSCLLLFTDLFVHATCFGAAQCLVWHQSMIMICSAARQNMVNLPAPSEIAALLAGTPSRLGFWPASVSIGLVGGGGCHWGSQYAFCSDVALEPG